MIHVIRGYSNENLLLSNYLCVVIHIFTHKSGDANMNKT